MELDQKVRDRKTVMVKVREEGKGNSPGQGPMTGGKKGIKEETKK